MIEESGMIECSVNPPILKMFPDVKVTFPIVNGFSSCIVLVCSQLCFVPEDSIRQLRTYIRLRNDHISLASQHIQHMQKALDSMNIKLHNVISNISGASGMRILKAIIQGERNPEILVELCDKIIVKTKRASVISSLKGNFREDYIFSLKQAVNSYGTLPTTNFRM